MKIVIDATGGILGRIAAYSAKQSLLGKEVIVVNCNEALITGEKNAIVEKYRRLRRMAGWSLKGPKILKTPERIMKRTIRGMLAHKKGRGSDAFKRIKCYNKIPNEFENVEKIELKRELRVKAHALKRIEELI
ncbi:50S ribosomal protein L13 [Candidatus Pacearchaeota archaeon]|nr:50S ribosomal protein L13 [Candidatus Pacearchaeota archaeon]